ncbi:MAG: AI-2E family transporter, partial [Mariprofundaceae bacterium]
MSTDTSHRSSALLAVACFIIIIAGIQAAQALIVPFLLSAFIACVCLPPMHALIKRNIPATLAVFIVIAGLLLVGFLLAAFAGASVADFSQNLPLYQERMKVQITEFSLWLSGFGINISSASILEHFDPSAAMGMAGSLLSGLGNVLANTFFIICTVIFLMFEGIALPHKWAAMGKHAPATDAVNQFLKSVNQYLVIKTLVSLATGAALTAWLTL